MINLVKALSVRESENLKNKMKDIGEEEEIVVKESCWTFTWMDRYMLQIDSPFIVIWNAISLTVNAVLIFTVYYEAAFRLQSLADEQAFAVVFECILVIDIMMNFC
jgi:hypothetical protein